MSLMLQTDNSYEKPQPLCWLQGKILPARQACISVYDHGLLYGDGVFEGLRFYHSKIFKLDEHLMRLQSSAAAISLKIPLTLNDLKQALCELVEAYGHTEGYLRLVVTRGKGSLGIDPKKCVQPQCFIIVDELHVVDSQHQAGVKAIFAQTRQKSLQGINPAIKSLNYLNNILARIEATAAGADEAIMLNDNDEVTEGCVDNIFIVKHGVLKTPALSCGLLAGITRQIIIDLALKNNGLVEECILTTSDILTADECFLTGTGAEMIAVRQIDEVVFPLERPVFHALSRQFRALIDTQCVLANKC